jgi:hypothetical protein
MKKIFTLSVFAFFAAILFAGCVKDGNYGNSESYWLSKERGEVVYSDNYCSYFVVETNLGYNVVHSNDGYKPFEQSILYGNFSSRGTREIYNRSTGVTFYATVTDYWLSYAEAQDALDYYCPLKNGAARTFSKADNGKGTQTFTPK